MGTAYVSAEARSIRISISPHAWVASRVLVSNYHNKCHFVGFFTFETSVVTSAVFPSSPPFFQVSRGLLVLPFYGGRCFILSVACQPQSTTVITQVPVF